MIPVTVVVAFHSRCGSSETRALTAAVGAVQARALIRMRRMTDVDDAPSPRGGSSDPPPASPALPASPATLGSDCAEHLSRMRREYVPPTEADLLGTDGLVVAAPGNTRPESAEWAPLAAMLSKLHAEGKLRGKVAGIVDGGDPAVVHAFATLLHGMGLIVVPPTAVDVAAPDAEGVERARAHGRFVANLCRAIKTPSP